MSITVRRLERIEHRPLPIPDRFKTAEAVAVDTADAIASLRQIRGGAMSDRAKLLVAAGAAAFAALGTAALAAVAGPAAER
jgi:hypothetical protein